MKKAVSLIQRIKSDKDKESSSCTKRSDRRESEEVAMLNGNHEKRCKFAHSLNSLLNDSSVMSFFIQFFEREGKINIVHFWMKVESFKSAFDNDGPQSNVHLSDATRIFERYVNPSSSHTIAVPQRITVKIKDRIDREDISSDLFDEAQDFVYQLLKLRYFEEFKGSIYYKKHQLEVFTKETIEITDIIMCQQLVPILMEIVDEKTDHNRIQFVLATETFELEWSSTSDEELEKDAMSIYDRFMSLQASNSVGFPDSIRMDAEKRICTAEGRPEMDSFTCAKRWCCAILSERYLSHVKSSTVFADFLIDLQLAITHNVELPLPYSRGRGEYRKGSQSSSTTSCSSARFYFDVSPPKLSCEDEVEYERSSSSMSTLSLSNGRTQSKKLAEVDELGRYKPLYNNSFVTCKKDAPNKLKKRLQSYMKSSNLREEEIADEVARSIIADIVAVSSSRFATPPLFQPAFSFCMDVRKDACKDAREMEDLTSMLVPFVGSALLCIFCYFLGKNEFSLFWLIVLIAFNVVKSYLWKKRESRLLSLRAARTREREVLAAQLSDLPAWVTFPDTERVEWLNKVIQQLWPYIGEYTKVFMTDIIVPQVKMQMPSMFKNFKFTKMDIGDMGCRVGGIKVYTTNVGRDRIIVDMDIAYAGDADFTISCCGFTGGMNQIQLSGKLRCILKPLLPYPPMVGGISSTFLEMPKIDFNLTGMGEMVEVPGLMNAIRTVVDSQVAAMCVVPNEIVIPLVPDVDVTQLFFPEPNGLLRLKVIEARNLENRDISFIKKGKSDPYCDIQVGAQFFKTKTVDNDLNPVWGESFEAVVDVADGQHLRLECFDEDRGQDEELGRLNIPLGDIRDSGTVDKWYPLEGCKHGDIHLKAAWFSLSSNPSHLEKEEWEAEWIQSDKAVHSALLLVFIDNISDLPYPKAKLEPSPFVELSLGTQVQKTAVKTKTVNPLFQQRFHFFVKNPSGQELKLEAKDEGTGRSLGVLSLPLAHLIREPRMEMYQSTVMLTLGVHQSPLVVTLRLRGLVPPLRRPINPDDLDEKILQHYATGSYIERANGDVWRGSGEIAKITANTPSTLSPAKSLLSANNGTNGSVQSLKKKKNGIGRIFSKKERPTIEIEGGEVELEVKYIDSEHHLQVSIIRARVSQIVRNGVPVYATCTLVKHEDGKAIDKRKTGRVEDTAEPIFDNQFKFDISKSDISNYRVLVKLKEDSKHGMLSRQTVLGQVDMHLGSLPGTILPLQWVPLRNESK